MGDTQEGIIPVQIILAVLYSSYIPGIPVFQHFSIPAFQYSSILDIPAFPTTDTVCTPGLITPAIHSGQSSQPNLFLAKGNAHHRTILLHSGQNPLLEVPL